MYSTQYTDLVWISAGDDLPDSSPAAALRELLGVAADLPPDVQSVELTDVNDIMSGHGRFSGSGSGVDSRPSGTGGGCSIR